MNKNNDKMKRIYFISFGICIFVCLSISKLNSISKTSNSLYTSPMNYIHVHFNDIGEFTPKLEGFKIYTSNKDEEGCFKVLEIKASRQIIKDLLDVKIEAVDEKGAESDCQKSETKVTWIGSIKFNPEKCKLQYASIFSRSSCYYNNRI
jgi:hypothetical protein